MKKVGLALGSGAVRGMIHIGVLKTLVKHKIPIDFIAGSSIGAWVGAHYALFQNVELLEKVTVENKWEKLVCFLEPCLSGGMVKGDKLEKLLNEWLKNSRFKDTKIPLRIMATDLIKGDEVIFKSGSLTKAVQASMAVPGVFKPIFYKNKFLVDAGVCNPVPDEIVREMGADIVIAVNLDNFQDDRVKNYTKVSDVALRTAEVMRHHLAKNTLNDADIIIQPPLGKYSNWSDYFIKKDMAREIVQIGVEETEKIIPHLKTLLKR